MIVSRRWLEAFLGRALERRDLVNRLAMLGAPVDLVEPIGAALAPVVVGLVAELKPHPNADRLQVCQVEIGAGERRQVVTGATNVALGRKYPFAPIGTTLPTGITLEKRKLRGELSEGMLCSPDELGIGTEHDGLMTLETEAAPGTPVTKLLALDDERLVLDVSPMRGDLWGHKGVARELGASFNTGFRLPPVEGATGPADGSDIPAFVRSEAKATAGGIEVSIEPGSACARFTAAVIDGVKVGPSPLWLKQRLESVGQRSINNVVDVTNYVMLEVGQPLHAFDGDKIRGGRLFARLARPGEKLRTLDDVDRSLDGSMTVVADGGGAVGVAGIIGGGDSEVGQSTTRVVLEAAWWNPSAIRTTRKALNVITEASQRFERGADLWGLPDALRRAVTVLLAVAGGRVIDQPIDVWPEPTVPPRIFVRVARVRQIAGIELSLGEIERTLTAIGCTVLAKPEDGRVAVDVPGWRRDLVSEIDLIEEVVRIFGYDQLPDALRPFRVGSTVDPESEELNRMIRPAMAAEGLLEAVLLPIGPATGPSAIPVLNPLSAEHGFLRERLLPGLIRQVEANWANQVRDVRLFEIGTAFSPAAEPRPEETLRLAAVITGARSPEHWTDGGNPPSVDMWDLKGLFHRAVSLANPGASVQVEGGELVAQVDGRTVGRAAVLAADAPRWAAPLFGFEIDLDPAPRARPPFVAPPAMPASARDLALIVPWAVTSAQVREAMQKSGGGLLESVAVVDEYRGSGLPAGTRSVAFRLVFRGRDRTLRDSDVDSAVNRIRSSVEKQLGVTQRTS